MLLWILNTTVSLLLQVRLPLTNISCHPDALSCLWIDSPRGFNHDLQHKIVFSTFQKSCFFCFLFLVRMYVDTYYNIICAGLSSNLHPQALHCLISCPRTKLHAFRWSMSIDPPPCFPTLDLLNSLEIQCNILTRRGIPPCFHNKFLRNDSILSWPQIIWIVLNLPVCLYTMWRILLILFHFICSIDCKIKCLIPWRRQQYVPATTLKENVLCVGECLHSKV